MAHVPSGFEASPSVQDWIRKADSEKQAALTDLLIVLETHFLPGGSLLRISPHKDPAEIPAGFTVPFDDCLLLYEVPLRTEEPIKLLLVFDPYTPN